MSRIAANKPGMISAVIGGLVFALLYTGPEISTENRDATHSISVLRTPLIWFLASTLFYLVLHAAANVRTGKVKERPIAFGFRIAGAVLLTLFWLHPMLAGLLGCFGGGGC